MTTLFERRQGVYQAKKSFRCSTSRFGVGEQSARKRLPRGLHRIAEKVGGGWPVGAAFKSRQLIGFTWQGRPFAPIAHRILWLEGLEPGWNRGGEVDSYRRYIYIHGTGNETDPGPSGFQRLCAFILQMICCRFTTNCRSARSSGSPRARLMPTVNFKVGRPLRWPTGRRARSDAPHLARALLIAHRSP
jgi:hypothetical protein